MSDLKLGEPFGLDPTEIAKIDWNLARARILHDVKTDFIYAPHISFIYRKAGEELTKQLTDSLKAGKYMPGAPLTIEVPKSARFRLVGRTKRAGPHFSRPGSILMPLDRLLYQALADQAAPVINQKLDKVCSFSHQLATSQKEQMFRPARECWKDLQTQLAKYSKDQDLRYVVKIDIANYFGSLNLHVLINVLHDAKYSKSLGSRLEVLLTHFTMERSSRGILQGVFPSDLLGNFYMVPVDRFLSEAGFKSARYVDDIYIFVSTVAAAEELIRQLIPFLRSYDLRVRLRSLA